MLERPKRRLNFLAFVLALLCLVILSQLVRIQFFSHQELMTKGRQVRTRQSVLPPVRGRVWDRHGHLLVGNLVQYDITAAPALLSDVERIANILDYYLDVDREELVEKLSSDQGWVLVKRGVPQEIGDQIAAREMVGIAVEPVWRRAFPEECWLHTCWALSMPRTKGIMV